MAVMRCDSTALSEGLAFLDRIRGESAPSTGKLIGPLPAAMARRAGRFRSQLIVLAGTRRELGQIMQALVTTAEGLPQPRGLNWFVDVDPIETL